ncbi:MAG TPA: hypothetical protein DGG95_13985, partial [Cytophagales bacterium]|nr:hypothetical protein [Cytophagales bacterium]
MKLTRVKVKNFRSLHDVELKGLEQFNVLIGKNNSGKSAFFGAIHFLADVLDGRSSHVWANNIVSDFSKNLVLEIHLEFELSSEERQRVVSQTAPKDRKDVWFNSMFARDLQFKFRSLATQPEVVYPFETIVRTVKGDLVPFQKAQGVSQTPNGLKRFPAEIAASFKLFDEDYTEPLTIIHSGGARPVVPVYRKADFDVPWAKNINESVWPFFLLANYLKNAFFFDHVRKFYNEQSVGGNGQLQQDGGNLVQVLNYWSNNNRPKFDKIQKLVQKAFATVGGLETPFVVQNQQNIQTAFRNDASSYQIPLQHMGGGVAQMLMAATVLETTSSEHPIFIEEPETNLHPGAQRFLAEQFCEQNRQVFITTHSPTFINLQRPKSVHKISMSGGKTTAVSLDDDTLHIALSEIGARNSDVLLSDAVVFVEGESDLKVVQEWCRVAGIELSGTNTSVLPMHSLGHPTVSAPLRSETLKAIAKSAGIPHLFILDSDELSEAVIQRLKKELGEHLHIFEKRELENYLLVPSALRGAVYEKLQTNNLPTQKLEDCKDKEVEKILKCAADKLKNRILIKRVRSHLESPKGGFYPRSVFAELEPYANRQGL